MENYDPYNCLVPIFRETNIPRGIKQIASAVFARHEWGYFLFTAAHVTDDMESNILLVPANGRLTEIKGYIGHIDLLPGTTRNDDDIDIAYIKIPHYLIAPLRNHFTPLEGNNFQLIKSALELSICTVSGYPAKKGKKNKTVYSSEIFSFSGVAAKQEVYDELSLSTVHNIVIHFNRKNTINPEIGVIRESPSLKGVSGGGIFAWPTITENIPGSSEKKLVGIFHTYKEDKGLIIGTTLLSFFGAIQLGNMKNFGGVI